MALRDRRARFPVAGIRPSSPPSSTSSLQVHSRRMQAVGFHMAGPYQPNAAGACHDLDMVGVALAIAVVSSVVGTALLVYRHRRSRRCSTCQPPREMVKLDEEADNAHLEPGQLTEERLGSVNYDVFVCPGCQVSKVLRRGRFGSGYGACPNCAYKTMHSSSETTTMATYAQSGEITVTENCEHCAYTNTYVLPLAMLVSYEDSSSSSSDSSSDGDTGQ